MSGRPKGSPIADGKWPPLPDRFRAGLVIWRFQFADGDESIMVLPYQFTPAAQAYFAWYMHTGRIEGWLSDL